MDNGPLHSGTIAALKALQSHVQELLEAPRAPISAPMAGGSNGLTGPRSVYSSAVHPLSSKTLLGQAQWAGEATGVLWDGSA